MESFKPKLTPEFLETLFEAVQRWEYGAPLGVLRRFVKDTYILAGQVCPDFDMTLDEWLKRDPWF